MEISKEMVKAAADAYWGADVRHGETALQQMRLTLVAALRAEPCEPVAWWIVGSSAVTTDKDVTDRWRLGNPDSNIVRLYASPTSLGVDIEEVKRQARADALEGAAKLATTCINPADRCKCSTAYEISAAIRALSKIAGGEDGK